MLGLSNHKNAPTTEDWLLDDWIFIKNISDFVKMASNDNGNLVQEFEESFQKCLTSLTEEDDLFNRDPDDINKDIDEKISQFTDVARQLETFFLQKRFMIYNHKPEMILKEDTGELKVELVIWVIMWLIELLKL